MVTSNDGRKANISVALVAILITSTLAGLTFGVDNAAAVSDFSVSGIPTGAPIYGPSDSITVTVKATFDTGETDASCTYYLDVNGNKQIDNDDPDIGGSDPACPDPTEASVGEKEATFTWTPFNDLPADTEEDGLRIIAVISTTAAGGGGDQAQTATQNSFGLDGVAPTLDGPNTVLEEGSHVAPVGQLDAASSFGPGPYDITFAINDGFPDSYELLACSGGAPDTGTVIASNPNPVAASQFIFTGVTLSSMDDATPAHANAPAFALRATDEAGNVATFPSASSCYSFTADDKGPSLSKEGLPSSTAWYKTAPTFTACQSTCNGEDFQITGEPNAVDRIELRRAGNPPVSSGPADGNGVFSVLFDVADGTHSVEVVALDEFGNPSNPQALTVNLDQTPPTLSSLTVDDDGPCDPTTLTPLAQGDSPPAYCSGPYTVTASIEEEFPAMDAGTPETPAIVTDDFTFPSSATHTETDQTNGPDVHTWTWTGVTLDAPSAAPFPSFTLSLDEREDFGAEADTLGPLEFGLTLEGTPQANFQPASPVVSGSTTFTITEVDDQDGTCPSLDANRFCDPGTSTPTIDLIDLSTGSPTVLASFTDNGDDTWSATWAPTQSQAVEAAIRIAGDNTGFSNTASLVADVDEPEVTNDNITVYEWAANNDTTRTERWWATTAAESNDKHRVPQKGLYLVKVDYTSFSAREISFRFIEENDREEPESEQKYLEYTFRVADDGTLAGQQHLPMSSEDQVVHLARGVPLEGGVTTPSSGCTGSGLLLWGQDRSCYFLIETRSQPDASQFSVSSEITSSEPELGDGDAYRLQVRIIEVDGDTGETDPATGPEVQAEKPEANLASGDPKLSQEPVETGVSNALSLEIKVGGTDEYDTTDGWVCQFHPLDASQPDPSVDDPYAGYMNGQGPSCEADDEPEPTAGSVRAKALTVELDSDGDDNGDRRAPFVVTHLKDEDGNRALDTGEDPIDQLYFRLILRDKYGNLNQIDLIDGEAPGVFDIAQYAVGSRLVDDVPQRTQTSFLENSGCFALGGSNTQSTPCLRELQHAPSPDYPTIDIPFIIQNRGNLPDTLSVDWDHVSGQSDWTVTLIDARNPGTSSQDELELNLNAPARLGDAVQRRVIARFAPPADAVGGEDRLIRINVESEGASSLVAAQDLYLQARLKPLDRASLVLGPDEVAEVTNETRPDARLFVPANLLNAGNTEGSFSLGINEALSTDRSASDELCTFNALVSEPEDHIILRTESQAGTPEESIFLGPGEHEDLRIRVDIGRNIPASQVNPYRCVIQVERDGTAVAVAPLEPTINLDVIGVSDIKVLELRGAQRQEWDITGAEVTEVVPPGTTQHTVELWLENNGTVSLDPELTIDALQDKLQLGGEWTGVREDGTSVSRQQVKQSFQLKVSDGDDPTRIKDHLTSDGEFRSTSTTGNSGPWTCLTEDDPSNEPDDSDDRVVCRLNLVFNVPTKNGEPVSVAGDELLYRFSWQDVGGSGTPATVDVRLVFGHVGQVLVNSVTQPIVESGDTTTIEFNASLFEGHRFDLENQQTVPATLRVQDDTGASVCAAPLEITSLQPSLTQATFRVPVEMAAPSGGTTCAFDAQGDLRINPAGLDDLRFLLEVSDENGSALRQVVPAQVLVRSGAQEPSEVRQLELFPRDTMNANGTQFARLLFAQPSGSGAVDDVLLTRGHEGLEAHAEPALQGLAHSTDGGVGQGLTWTVLQPAPEAGDYFFEDPSTDPTPDQSNDRIPIQPTVVDDHRPGQLLRQVGSGDDERATAVGLITLNGWGNGDNITWQEGWNPIVLHVEDLDGDVAGDNVDLDVQFQFVGRNDDTQNGPCENQDYVTDSNTDRTPDCAITHQWKWDTNDLPVTPLGAGYFATAIYLPDLLDANGDLKPAYNDIDVFTDHPDQKRQATYWNWTMEVDIARGDSRGGDPLQGEAYWALDDLGLANQDGTLRLQDNPLVKSSEVDVTFTSNPERQSQRFLHASLDSLLPRSGSQLTTGPGLQDLRVFIQRETIQPVGSRQTLGDERTADDYAFHRHEFGAENGARVVATVKPFDRLLAPGGGTFTLAQSDDSTKAGQYTGVVNLPDLGLESFQWFLELRLFERDGTQIGTLSQTVLAEEDRSASMNGLPMPLLIEEPTDGWEREFPTSTLLGRSVLDTRAIPGLLMDRGPFQLTPVATIEDAGELKGIRHDNAADLLIRGKGLITIDTSELPGQAELDVPIPLSVRAAPLSTVQSVKAELYKAQELVAETTLTLDESNNLYGGSLTPIELGAHRLVIVATDVQAGVSVVEKAVEVVENAPPRITITSPVAVGGERAMKPGDAVVAQVSDRSITGDAITVFRQSGTGGGDDTTPEPLVENGDQVNLTLDPSPTENASTTLSIHVHTNDTDENVDTADGNLLEGQSVWVNWTKADGTQELINATLDADGNASATVTFDAAGSQTLTVEVPGNVSEEFTISVAQETSGGGGGDLTDDTSNAEIDCQTTACTVRYTPDGQDGDVVRFKIVAEIGTEDTNDTGIIPVTLDGTAPTPTPTIGQPKVAGSPPTVAPTTTVELSGDGDVVSYLVSGIVSGTEVGKATVERSTGEVVLSQIGLTDSGQARIRVAATDLAGNTGSTTLDVRVDAAGPTLSGADVTRDGPDVNVEVDAEDDAGVQEVLLYFRKPGDDRFTTKKMAGTDGTFTGTVTEPGSTGTLRYYIEATDRLGNRQSLGSQTTPQSLSLGDVPPGSQQAPEVVITSPSPNARVSGTIDVRYEATDPEGDSVTIRSIRVQPTSGQGLTLQGQDGVASLDTTQLAEGAATIVVEAFDGVATGSGTVQVIVDNKPDAGPCADEPLQTGKNVEVCFQMATGSDVDKVVVELLRNGDTLQTKELDPSASGVYRTNFDFGEEGNYALKIVKEKSDGSTEETTSETFQVQSAAEAIAPLGRFITALVLGVLVMGLAAFAAFGRWN